MSVVTLSNDYRIEIPADVREEINLQVGAEFEVMVYDGMIELVPIVPIENLKGMFPGLDTTNYRDGE